MDFCSPPQGKKACDRARPIAAHTAVESAVNILLKLRYVSIVMRPTPAGIAGLATIGALEASSHRHALVEAAIALPITIAVMLGFTWNDVYDMEKDRVARRLDKPLATGTLDARAIVTISAVLFTLGATVAVIASGMVGMSAFVVLCLLVYLYSPFAKACPSLKVIYAAALCLAPYLFVYFVFGARFSPFLYLLVFLFFIFREIAIDATEIDGDRRSSYRTISVALGHRLASALGWGGMLVLPIVTYSVADDAFAKLALASCIATLLLCFVLFSRYPIVSLNLTRVPLSIMAMVLPFMLGG